MEATEVTRIVPNNVLASGGAGHAANMPGGGAGAETAGGEARGERAGRPFYEAGGNPSPFPLPPSPKDRPSPSRHWAFEPQARGTCLTAGAGGDPSHPDWDRRQRPGAWTFRTCKRCGKTFHYVGFNRQFCGDECARKWHGEQSNRLKAEKRAAKRGPRPCARCGKTFEPKNARAKYCSKACAMKAFRKTPTFDPIDCAWCGRTFLPTRGTQKYCSAPCFKRAYEKHHAKRSQRTGGKTALMLDRHWPMDKAELKVRAYLSLPAAERWRRRGDLTLGERLLAQQIWDADHRDRVVEVN